MTTPRADGNVAAKDEARTPPEIFRKLDEEFQFGLDAAATPKNTLAFYYNSYIDEDHNGLTESWIITRNDGTVAPVYCNPPYSSGNILRFVHKAWLESGNGATVVLLIPSDASTEYFDFCFNNAAEIRYMQPRIRFNDPDGIPMKSSPPMGSMIVVFRPGEDGPAKTWIWRWKE